MADPTEHFIRVFRDMGAGCVRTCDRCGLTAFNSEGMWDWDEGELEKLQKAAEEDPKSFRDVDHSVGGYVIWGIFISEVCECGPLVEKMLLRDRERLSEYLGAILSQRIADDQATLDTLSDGKKQK